MTFLMTTLLFLLVAVTLTRLPITKRARPSLAGPLGTLWRRAEKKLVIGEHGLVFGHPQIDDAIAFGDLFGCHP